MPGPRGSTRSRLIAESMRLFGERGYSGTSVSQIEAAAGLSGGSGSLYRHFASKEALLSEGIRAQVAAGKDLLALVREASQRAEAEERAAKNQALEAAFGPLGPEGAAAGQHDDLLARVDESEGKAS